MKVKGKERERGTEGSPEGRGRLIPGSLKERGQGRVLSTVPRGLQRSWEDHQVEEGIPGAKLKEILSQSHEGVLSHRHRLCPTLGLSPASPWPSQRALDERKGPHC